VRRSRWLRLLGNNRSAHRQSATRCPSALSSCSAWDPRQFFGSAGSPLSTAASVATQSPPEHRRRRGHPGRLRPRRFTLYPRNGGTRLGPRAGREGGRAIGRARRPRVGPGRALFYVPKLYPVRPSGCRVHVLLTASRRCARPGLLVPEERMAPLHRGRAAAGHRYALLVYRSRRRAETRNRPPCEQAHARSLRGPVRGGDSSNQRTRRCRLESRIVLQSIPSRCKCRVETTPHLQATLPMGISNLTTHDRPNVARASATGGAGPCGAEEHGGNAGPASNGLEDDWWLSGRPSSSTHGRFEAQLVPRHDPPCACASPRVPAARTARPHFLGDAFSVDAADPRYHQANFG